MTTFRESACGLRGIFSPVVQNLKLLDGKQNQNAIRACCGRGAGGCRYRVVQDSPSSLSLPVLGVFGSTPAIPCPACCNDLLVASQDAHGGMLVMCGKS